MNKTLDEMDDDEFAQAMERAFEEEARTHEGGMAMLRWEREVYPKLWHEAWDAGRKACLDGVSRDQNPHRLKVWREVWWYGWDNYDPSPPAIFRQVEERINELPTRPMTEKDL